MTSLRNIFFGLSLFFVSVYLPVMSLSYTNSWSYELNCHFHERCDRMGMERVERYADNLTAFFRHQQPLQGSWTEKERSHLKEVRDLYDLILPLFGLALALVIVLGRKANRARTAAVNLAVVVVLLVALPWFKPFWQQIFHAALFDNLMWKNYPTDVSWYITPRLYFRNAAIYIVSWGLLINLAVYFQARRQSKT